MINEFHKQGSAFYFGLFDPDEKRLLALPIFPMLFAALSCLLSRLFDWAKWQGKGLMFEALSAAIRYMQRTQHIHRIMANYMPHNKRSGDLLARLGFEKKAMRKTIC